MKQFILSSSTLRDLLEEPIMFFHGYDIDFPSIVACGLAVLNSENPTVAKGHLIDDLCSSVNNQVTLTETRNEVDSMFDVTADLLGSYVKTISGQSFFKIELLNFVGADPIVGVRPHDPARVQQL